MLVDPLLPGRPVDTAGGGEHKAANPGCLGNFRQPHGGRMVDVVGGLGQQIPERVIADAVEMGDRVDTLEIAARHLSDIAIDRRDPAVLVAAKGAILVELDVDADDLVTGQLEPLDERATDIAAMPRYQDAHLFLLPAFP